MLNPQSKIVAIATEEMCLGALSQWKKTPLVSNTMEEDTSGEHHNGRGPSGEHHNGRGHLRCPSQWKRTPLVSITMEEDTSGEHHNGRGHFW